MTDGGWYPDPGGRPGLYRYWDGSRWSTELTADPRTPAPGNTSAPRQPAGTDRRRRRGGWVVAVVVVVVLAIVGVVIGTRSPSGSTAGPDPGSTASGWDDSSPLATPTPTASTPTASGRSSSATPTPKGRPTGGGVACPFESGVRNDHPVDGRVHGGRLSFPPAPEYPAPEPDPSFSWWGDATGQTQPTEPGWISIFAVGQTRTADDGFATPKQAAESSMQCAITEGWYAYFTDRRDLKNQAVTIDGHDGWIITAEIRVADPDISVAGDRLTFIAVDDGRSDWLSVFCGMVPLGDTARLSIDDRVRSQLRVD